MGSTGRPASLLDPPCPPLFLCSLLCWSRRRHAAAAAPIPRPSEEWRRARGCNLRRGTSQCHHRVPTPQPCLNAALQPQYVLRCLCFAARHLSIPVSQPQRLTPPPCRILSALCALILHPQHPQSTSALALQSSLITPPCSKLRSPTACLTSLQHPHKETPPFSSSHRSPRAPKCLGPTRLALDSPTLPS